MPDLPPMDPQQILTHAASAVIGLGIGWAVGRRGQMVRAAGKLSAAIHALAKAMKQA